MRPDSDLPTDRPLIVVGADFTHSSQPALERARLLATQTASGVIVAHVVPPTAVVSVPPAPGATASILMPSPNAEGAAALRSAAQLAEERFVLDVAGVEASAVVRVGHAAEQLAAIADSRGAWLLVVGLSPTIARDESLVLGTTAELALRFGSTPVLVASGIAAAPYRRVLLPLVPDDLSLLVLRTVALMAPNAIYDVVHFLPPAKARTRPSSTHRDAVLASLAGLCAAAGLDPVRTQVMAIQADPRDGITAEIKRRRPDLVAVGTHATSGLARLAFGSLADHVIHTSVGVDVLAVPPEPQSGPRAAPALETAAASPVAG